MREGTKGDYLLLGRTIAATKLLQRTGARNVEVSVENEDSEEPTWRARGEWDGKGVPGQTVTESLCSESFPYPAQAAEDLLGRVLNGGQCKRCGRTTVVGVEVPGLCAFILTAGGVEAESSYAYQRSCEPRSIDEVHMDRAARRRAARADAKAGKAPAPEPVMIAGEPYHEAEGRDQGSAAKLPPKVDGQHRWIVTAGYTVSAESAARAQAEMDGAPPVPKVLDHESRFSIAVGCYDCEEPLGAIKVTSVCPAADGDLR